MHSLKNLINPKLIEKAYFYQQLTLSLRSRLPEPLAKHCWVGGFRGNTLIVVTDSSHWATPIRYQQHELLKQINEEFGPQLHETLIRLKIKVVSGTYGSKKPIKRPELSASNAHRLASLASTMADPELKSALLSLAKRGQDPD